MKIIDISRKISEENLFEGQKYPVVNFKKSIIKGNKCNISVISDFESHTGSHVDFPFHMIEGGKKSGDYDIEKFHGVSYVVDLTKNNNLIEKISNINLNNKILLIKTPERDLDKDYFYLSIEEVAFLISKKIKNIGIDTLSIDGFGNTNFPNHKSLFLEDILIYEGLDFNNVNEGYYTFYGLPLNIDNLEAGLTRPFLIPN